MKNLIRISRSTLLKIIKNFKSFCRKSDAFDRAGIRAWVFRLPVILWRTVLGSTLSHVLPHQHTDQRAQQRPLLLSAFPHHARMGIKGRLKSREEAVRPGRRAGSVRSVALDERPGDASPGGYSHRKVSPAPSDFLVEADRALANGRSHGQFSVRAGT